MVEQLRSAPPPGWRINEQGAWVRETIHRMDACALNHVAQLLAGEGAAEINYRGMRPLDVERLAAQAVCWEPCK